MLGILESIIFNNKDLCYLCREMKDDYSKYICSWCFDNLEYKPRKANRQMAYVDEIYYGMEYNRYIREIIREFKFHHKGYLYKPLGQILLWLIKEFNLGDRDLIVPVPMYRTKEARRGYNQTKLLAGYIEKETSVACMEGNLIKIKNTLAQSGLDGVERKHNLRGVFKILEKSHIRDKKILLLDDIVTTGSTIEECARILKSEGAKTVEALVLVVNRD